MNGIPPRLDLREASGAREAIVLQDLPLGWEAREDRTGSNGYKNGSDFIITLVVVNFNSSSLTQIDTSYSISNRISLSIFWLTPITLLHRNRQTITARFTSTYRLALTRTETR